MTPSSDPCHHRMSSSAPSPGRPRRRRAESSCAQGAQVGCGQERKNSQNNPKCQNKGGRGFVLTGEAEGQNKNMIAVIAARFHFPRRRQRSVVVGLGCQFVKLRIPGLREHFVVLVQCVKIRLRSPKGARGAQKTEHKTWENICSCSFPELFFPASISRMSCIFILCSCLCSCMSPDPCGPPCACPKPCRSALAPQCTAPWPSSTPLRTDGAGALRIGLQNQELPTKLSGPSGPKFAKLGST